MVSASASTAEVQDAPDCVSLVGGDLSLTVSFPSSLQESRSRDLRALAVHNILGDANRFPSLGVGVTVRSLLRKWREQTRLWALISYFIIISMKCKEHIK